MDQINFSKFSLSGIPTYLKITFAVLGVLLLFFTVQSFRGDKLALQKLNDAYSPADSTMDLAANNDELFALLKRQSYNSSNLRQAESDSIGLRINLADSTLSLMLKGVELHSSKMKNFGYSKILDKMDRSSAVSMLSSPLFITSDSSNVAKEPIRRVQAPKNEEEAALLLSQNVPDTVKEFVALRLMLDNNILVVIEEEPDSIPREASSYIDFLSAYKSREKVDLWKSLLTLKTPTYQPQIKIYLPHDEAKSIYRALPNKGTAVLKMP